MKLIDDITNEPLAVLLIGPPGSGKTTYALQFPDVWVADCDNNLAGPVRYLKSVGKFKPFKADSIQFDDDGKPITPAQSWERLVTKTQEALKSPDIKTIIIDSLTHVDRILLVWCMEKLRKATPEFDVWNMFKLRLYDYLVKIRSGGKSVIVICHEKIEYDKNGSIDKFVPAVSTNLKDYFGYLFTDVWRSELHLVGGKYEHNIRVTPTALHDLKNSLLLTNTINSEELLWKTIK